MDEYGLIGFPLSHSFSKKYFTDKFVQTNNNNCTYHNFEIAQISLLKNLLQHNQLKGLNVTIPYKQQVLSYLDYKSPVVETIHACNCIKIINNKLYGYNTDVIGFEESFKEKLNPFFHRKALILGTGGASAAVQYVLTKLQIPFKLVSRNLVENGIQYAQLNEKIYADYTIIINTTPVGTFPTINEAPQIHYNYINERFYLYDLVYNPQETLFLKLGAQKKATTKNGYDMLTIQAEESWRIWNE